MTVYIDQYPKWIVADKPKWIGGGHLFGTDLAELHLFANSIGLKHEWFQGQGHIWPHYDLTASKRTKAIHFGAIPVQTGEIPEGVIRQMPKPEKISIDHDALDQVWQGHVHWRIHEADDLSLNYVPGEGDNPRVMLIGEAPGAQEDLKRRPFVGDSGLVLRELMTIAGLFTGFTPHFGEANCWLTNVVKFRPPGNRIPTMVEIMNVRHLLLEEWKAVGKPFIIVPVGGVALTAIFGRKISILKVAGKPSYHKSNYDNRLQNMTVYPMIHPSYGLRGGKQIQDLIEHDWEQLGHKVNRSSHER